jgi:glycosyltransferase involved in cell wall biosynthesis
VRDDRPAFPKTERTPPSVLQLIPRLDSGGAERAVLEIADALTKAGGRALVASEGGRLEAALSASGARLVRLPLASKNPLRILANGLALVRLVRREGIAVLHARSRAPAWSALIAAKLTGVRLVTTYHGLYRAKGPLKRWYNGVMARGARVIANSDFTAAHIAAAYPASRPRIVTIPRGVDLDLFDPEAVTAGRVAALRQSWGVADGQPVILVPGRLARGKGQDLAIEALAALNSKDPVAILIGDVQSETYRKALTDRLEELGLEGRVRLVGHCADMPAAYRAAALVLQPSRTPEAFGRIAAEAEACGVLVVASDLGAAPETVLTGEGATGFLFEPGNVAALAAALERALALSEAERAAMAARARAHVRARFALSRMCAATLAVYEAVRGDAG